MTAEAFAAGLVPRADDEVNIRSGARQSINAVVGDLNAELHKVWGSVRSDGKPAPRQVSVRHSEEVGSYFPHELRQLYRELVETGIREAFVARGFLVYFEFGAVRRAERYDTRSMTVSVTWPSKA